MNQGDVISAFVQQARGSSVSFVNPKRARWTKVYGPTSALDDEAHHICIEHSSPMITLSAELAKALPEGIATPRGSGNFGRFTYKIDLEKPPQQCQTADQLVATLVRAASDAKFW